MLQLQLGIDQQPPGQQHDAIQTICHIEGEDSEAQKELFGLSQTSPQSYMASYAIMGKILHLTGERKVNNPSAFMHSCVRNVIEGRAWRSDGSLAPRVIFPQ